MVRDRREYHGRVRAWPVVLVLGALSACNALLGLDPGEEQTFEDDGDGDGVADSQDTCPFVANPDQTDTDNDQRGDACDDCPTSPPTRDEDDDGLDDACDPCPLGDSHDDDGDGVMDACDVCPGRRDDGQDSDGDQIGDECDPTEGLESRHTFHAFTAIDPRWTSAVTWSSDGEALSPDVAGRLLLADVSTSRVSITSTFDLAADGVISVGAVVGMKQASCTVRCVGADCELSVTIDGATTLGPAVPTGKVELHLWWGVVFKRRPCEAVPAGVPPISIPTGGFYILQGPGTPYVEATPGSKVMNADILEQ